MSAPELQARFQPPQASPRPNSTSTHYSYFPRALASQDGSTRVRHHAETGLTRPKQGFVHVYDRILKSGTDPKGAQPFASVLRHLASPSHAPTPILAHCTAGKDRTGVLCALVLSLCGVPDDAVAHEYSLTDLGLGHRRDEFVGNLTRSGPLKDNRAAAERMVSSRPEAMLGTLALIRRDYGGVEEFVKGRCGLSDQEIEEIRRNLVVEVGDDQQLVDWEEHRKLLS